MSETFNIVGGGFSGLACAYYISRAGHNVICHEKSDQWGGMLNTQRSSYGLIETAANGMLNSRALEELCQDLQIPLLFPKKSARARYIFKGSPQKWPLSPWDSAKFAAKLVQLKFNKKKAHPKKQESIFEWGHRVLTPAAVDYLVSPGLQGIYAGDIKKLSASLILEPFFNSVTAAKPKRVGLVSFKKGMGELIERWVKLLDEMGVDMRLNSTVHQVENGQNYVICTNAKTAGEMVGWPDLADIEMLPLATVTEFYPENKKDLEGFGCLFPRKEKFNSLGVLFNNSVFAGRGKNCRAETWILGGAHHFTVGRLSDESLLDLIHEDRARFTGRKDQPLESHVKLWPRALPHYTIDLERSLRNLKKSSNVYLCGNYLGDIGLSRILQRAQFIAEQVSAK